MASGGASQAKLKEGDKHVSEAEKSLKTSWLKFNPDYDNASHSFDKAGLSYRTGKCYEKAVQAYERAADAHYKNNSYVISVFQAAKSYEQIAAIYTRDLKDVENACVYLQRSSTMYHESGHGDTAGQVLVKAAKIMESVDPQKAAFYYLETAELHDIEEKYRDEGKAIRAAVNMYARARDLDKMLETLQKLRKITEKTGNDKYLFEIAAVELVIHLHNDDVTAAERALDSATRLSGFSHSEYAPILEPMVEAYKEKAEEEFVKCCGDTIFKIMDNEVAKLARDLKTKLGFTGFDSVPVSEPGPEDDVESAPDIL